jgi:hypothetical protein
MDNEYAPKWWTAAVREAAVDYLVNHPTPKKTVKSSRMVTIKDGVLEECRDGTYEAAVHTSHGPRVLSNKRGGDDLSWKAIVNQLKNEIRKAAKLPDSMLVIGEIWEEIERCAALAEAKFRITLGRMCEPEVAEAAWMKSIFDDLKGHVSHRTLETAERLLGVVAATCNIDTPPQLRKIDYNRIAIEWETSFTSIQWLLSETSLPWPGIALRSLVVRHSKTGFENVATRIYHDALSAVDGLRREYDGYQQQNSLHHHASITPEGGHC